VALCVHGTEGDDVAATIDTIEFRSRVLRAIHYDNVTKVMALELRTGKIRVHRDVPRTIIDALALHSAPGVFYEKHLRTGLGAPVSRFNLTSISFLARLRKKSRKDRAR
jgi:hypothetical protein